MIQLNHEHDDNSIDNEKNDGQQQQYKNKDLEYMKWDEKERQVEVSEYQRMGTIKRWKGEHIIIADMR